MIFNLFLVFFTLVTQQTFANDLLVKITLSPAGSFEAKTPKLRGDVVKSGEKYTAESLWVKTNDLKTGIDLRDDHFHKHLNFEKNPKITLNNVEAQNGSGFGMLTVNGVMNKINFTYKSVADKKIEAVFKVKPSLFKLKEAKYFEIGVDDEVEIIASLDLK
jgi:hypothetical protein